MVANEKTGDYSYEEELLNDFDPLEDFSFDEDIDDDDSVLSEGPFGMPNPNATPNAQGKSESFADKDTPQERIEALFNQMPTLHKVLFGILERCLSPIATEELEEAINELKKHHHSVYAPSTFCSLLERASALEKVNEEGCPIEELEQEPDRIEIDGVEYWVVAQAPQVFWQITDPGRTQFETYQPLNAIQACYDAEPQYAEIFTTTLTLCAQEGGASVKDVGDAVEDEPVLQNPRRYAMYFIDKLERAGALDWVGYWTTSEYGRQYLDLLRKNEE